MKGKGEMTTYWLIGTTPERKSPNEGGLMLKIDEAETSIMDENSLNPQRSRKQAIAHNQHEQVDM